MTALALIAGLALAIYALRLLLRAPIRDESRNKQKVALETLARLWSKRKEAVLTIEELAHIWRAQAPETESDAAPKPVYAHAEIADFYETHVAGKVYFTETARAVMAEILSILDREGDCRSVVDTGGDPESNFQKDALDLLSRTTLLRHSLNVAEEMVRSIGKPGPMLSKALIAALAHDLGKLPSYRKALYSMGDHPLIALTVLEQVKGFGKLPFRDEVAKAIKDHHRVPKGLLGEALKEADQSARRKEMSAYMSTAGDAGQEAPSGGDSAKQQAWQDKGSAQAPGADIFGAGGAPEKKDVKVKEVDLPWFDPDRFLEVLRPYVNRLDGHRWEAFSMPDGHVYVQVKTLWEVAKTLAREKGDMTVLLGDTDRELKRNILYTIVTRLRTERDAIARGLVKDGYFGAPFIVRMSDGKEFSKGYYTPFTAEAFGCTVSELEKVKPGRLKGIAEVSPKFG